MIEDSFDKSDSSLYNFPNAIMPFTQTLRLSLDNVEGRWAHNLLFPRGNGFYSPEEFLDKGKGWQKYQIEFLPTPGITGLSKYLYADSDGSNNNDQFLWQWMNFAVRVCIENGN